MSSPAPSIFNERQLEVIEAEDNILCCACPGSGKTRVIIEKARRQLQKSPSAPQILVTFSRDAADQLRSRLSAFVGASALRNVKIGTFHSLAMIQVRKTDAPPRLLSQNESAILVQRAMKDAKVNIELQEAESIIATIKSRPSHFKADAAHLNMVRHYDGYLKSKNVCDFTDILIMANKGMKEGKIRPFEAALIIVDEFQDCDTLQLDWIAHHATGSNRLLAVGDDDQCIFRFRDSLGYRGMVQFEKLTRARTIKLETNYRSTAAILRHAEALIVHNKDRMPKHMIAARGEGKPPRLIEAGDDNHELQLMIQNLDDLCLKTPKPSGASDYWRFHVKEGQVAVLARTNQHLAKIERDLLDRKIPCYRPGGGIWNLNVSRAILAFLRALRAKDDIGLDGMMRWARVPDNVIIQIRRSTQNDNMVELLTGQTPANLPGGPVVEELFRHSRAWYAKLHTPTTDHNHQTAGILFGLRSYMHSVVTGTCGQADGVAVKDPRRTNLADLSILNTVIELLLSWKGTLEQRLMMCQKAPDYGVNSVFLTTFHGCKGLEWDNVFITNVSTGVVPHADSIGTADEIQEERRAFYVAMTRAKDTLTLYTRAKQHSTFLEEAQLYVQQSLTAHS